MLKSDFQPVLVKFWLILKSGGGGRGRRPPSPPGSSAYDYVCARNSSLYTLNRIKTIYNNNLKSEILYSYACVLLATFSIGTTTLGCNAVKPFSAHNMQIVKTFGKRVDKLVLNNEGFFSFQVSL